jgi:hypothetical protein
LGAVASVEDNATPNVSVLPAPGTAFLAALPVVAFPETGADGVVWGGTETGSDDPGFDEGGRLLDEGALSGLAPALGTFFSDGFVEGTGSRGSAFSWNDEGDFKVAAIVRAEPEEAVAPPDSPDSADDSPAGGTDCDRRSLGGTVSRVRCVRTESGGCGSGRGISRRAFRLRTRARMRYAAPPAKMRSESIPKTLVSAIGRHQRLYYRRPEMIPFYGKISRSL